MATTDECGPLLVGGGCNAETSQSSRSCTGDTATDTGIALNDGLLVGSGPGGCETGPMPTGWLAWALVLVAWMSRRGLALLLFVAMPAFGQVDAQRLQIDDGGAFPALWEADLGRKWHGAGTLSINTAHNLAVLRSPTGGDEQILLDRAQTYQGTLSWNLFGIARVGTSAPLHDVTFLGRPEGVHLGDWAVWLSIPTRAREDRPPSSWTVRVDIPSGPETLLLGGYGVITGTYAAEYRAGPLRGLVNIGAALQAPVDVPGTRWASTLVYGTGVRAEPVGPLWVTAEVEGSLPLRLREARTTHFPLEGLLSAGVELPPWISAGAGVGMGFTRGLGSPSVRIAAMVDVRPRPQRDRDQDGIIDRRDACIDDPEDKDGFRDRDGCPDEDNDRDGLLDAEDHCPDDAEVVNAYLDADGCPDQVTDVTVEIRAVDGLEVARVRFGEAEVIPIPAGRSLLQRIGGDEVQLQVAAFGFHGEVWTIPLHGEPIVHEVVLQPLPWSEVTVVVRSEDGRRIPGAVAVDDADAVSAAAPLRLPVGRHALTVSSPDHLPRTVEVSVPAVDTIAVEVVLRANPVEVDGSRVRLPQRIHFPLDEATLEAESEPVVDALAAWLTAHPEVVLLRIEGHADATGSSRYNYQLSLARAEAVRTPSSGTAWRPNDCSQSAAARPVSCAGKPTTQRGEWSS